MSGDKDNVRLGFIAIGAVLVVSCIVSFTLGYSLAERPLPPSKQQEFWVGEGQLLPDGRFAFRIQEPKK